MKKIGFGTYRLNTSDEKILKYAIEQGYRILDTAESYGTEKLIGDVLKLANRREFFIITKVSPENLTYKGVINSVLGSVSRLNTYIDLLLIHVPNPNIPLKETFSAMKLLQEKRIIRYYGVSNFDYNQTLEAIKYGIYAHQHEFSLVYRWYEDVLMLCNFKNIKFFAYRPFSNGDIFKDPYKSYIDIVAKKYNKTIAQIALKWIQIHGAIPIIGSKNFDHIKENIDLDFELSEFDYLFLEDLFRLLILNQNENNSLKESKSLC
ncbi:MAG: aldo/keto reductase [Candidatus Woesearchaeota archaeon]